MGDARREGAVARYIDVGQGDAALLGDGPTALLVDGGGWRGDGVAEKALLPVLARAGVRRIGVVIVSHADRDHCRGVLELADFVPIGEVWMTPGTARSQCGIELATRPGVRLRPVWAGARLTWRDWRFQVLAPAAGTRGSGNEESLVVRAESRGRSILFTGDVGHASEFALVHATPPGVLASTLLKVPHHGSAASTSSSLVASVRPRLAIVSAGAGNPFGHPSPKVLERLRGAGVPVLRVDRVGLVEVRWTDRHRWRLVTPAAPGAGLE
jgi:competence protein ComEC